MIATALRTEYLTDPIGIDIAAPRLFWTCEGGVRQTAYRIRALRDDTVVWDTGKVGSSRMTEIPWEGARLHSRDRVEWRVQLWDQDDVPGEWVAASFELGLLESEDWSASWITGDYRPRRSERYPVDSFRRAFDGGDIAFARLYITACGLYEARINGARVGDAILAPGFTSYDRRIHYQVYDVTALIRDGENVIAVDLADGWFRGAVGAMGVRNVYGTRTKLLAQLELVGADGSRAVVASDETWEWSNDGPVRFADLKDGETVDLRRSPTYTGRAHRTTHPVTPTAANNVVPREQERFTPEVTRRSPGQWLLDFGQNIAGYVELSLPAQGGERLRIRFAEHLDADGELDLAAIQVRAGKPNASPKQQLDLTLAEGANHYKTRFAVFGFRYAMVESDLDLTPDSITAIAVYSDMGTTASFASSHPLIDRLVQNTLWSMKGNFLDVPTDCPTRERAPWTGDVQIFTRTAGYLMDTSAFLRKWLQDLRDRQAPDGKVPCHAPDVRNNEYLPGIDLIKRMDGAAGWADAAVLVPYRMWELFRDEQLLRESYDSMKAHVEFQISRTNRTGLFGRRFPKPDRTYISNVGQAFGEWLEPEDVYQQAVIQDFIAPHPEEATAYLAYACELMVEVACILGHEADIPRFEEYRDGCRAAYVAQFTPIDTGRQSKLVRPLALGLLDGELAQQTFDRLVTEIERRDYRVGTGFLSTPLILPLLSRMGRTDVAYRMLENELEPGWLFEVVSGATTIWEDWGGKASRNHYSPGSVCQWIFETMCGIDVVGPNAFRIAPRPGGTLTTASLEYRSVFGTISSAWEVDGDVTRYTITVPPNTTAQVDLPGIAVHEVGTGTWRYEAA
jgi:alpha-L-rhamnosidase